MKVVLTKDIDKVGRLGDTINVADGFAVNWLMPQGLAVRAQDRQAKRLIGKRAYLDRKAQAVAQTKSLPALTESKAQLRKTERTKRDSQKIKQSRRLTNRKVGTPTGASGLKQEGSHGTRLRAG